MIKLCHITPHMPILMYEAKTQTNPKRDKRKQQVVEMKFLQKIKKKEQIKLKTRTSDKI
jgi:hypothetical protein